MYSMVFMLPAWLCYSRKFLVDEFTHASKTYFLSFSEKKKAAQIWRIFSYISEICDSVIRTYIVVFIYNNQTHCRVFSCKQFFSALFIGCLLVSIARNKRRFNMEGVHH